MIRRVIKNSLFNVGGYILPGILSIPALGYISRTLGVENFGYLSIILAIVGYSGIFDIGLTRTVIREVAIFKNDAKELKNILSTSIFVVGVLGIISGILIAVFIPNIMSILKIEEINHDFSNSLLLVSFIIPIFLVSQIPTALLEGLQEFLKLNIYKTISGLLIVLVPILFLYIHHSLLSTVMGIFIARLISLFIIFFYTRKYHYSISFNKKTFKRLIGFGGWIAISNIISPIMSYFDRFIISNRMGGDIVGYYTAPSEAIAKLGIFPLAIARAIFPLLSINTTSRNEIKKYAYIINLLTILPISLLFMYFAHFILSLWLGSVYADKSTVIFQILIMGFIFNSFAQIPYSNIQALGGSKITAYIHLLECIPYLIILIFLIKLYGLVGAAIAWSLRMIVDFITLVILDFRMKKR